MHSQLFEILLIEDDPGDIELTKKALAKSKNMIHLSVVTDGEEAISYLRQEGQYTNSPRPDLIFLDLNLPGMSGQEVLREIKTHQKLRSIPVVVLTTSDADEDIYHSYNFGANCYINKPMGLQEFIQIIQSIEYFWFTVVKLPNRSSYNKLFSTSFKMNLDLGS